MPKFLLCVCVNPRESEKWESRSDFNGNLRPAETVSSIAKLYWFSALFVLCQKARTWTAINCPFLRAYTTKPPPDPGC